MKVSVITYVNIGSYELAIVEDSERHVRVAVGAEARNTVRGVLPEIFKCEGCGRVFHCSNIGLLKIKNGRVMCLCRNCVLSTLRSIMSLVEQCC